MVRSWPSGNSVGSPVKRQAKEQYASEGISDYFGFPTKYPYILARLKEKNIIIEALSSKVASDYSHLSADARWKLTHGLNTSGLVPARSNSPTDPGVGRFNDEGSDSIWYHLDDNGIWFARGGRVELSSGRNQYWVGLWAKNQRDPYIVYRGEDDKGKNAHKWVVEIVTVSRDGKTVASADKFGQIHVWDARTAKPIRVFDSANHARIWNVEWNRDGSGIHFSTQSNAGKSYDINTYGECNKFFELNRRYISDARLPDENQPIQPEGTNKETLTINHNGRSASFTDPAFGVPSSQQKLNGSLDGLRNLVALGSESGKIVVLELLPNNQYRIRRWFHGHHGTVTGLSQSPDGKLLASSSIDGTIRFWSLDNMASYSGDIDFKFRGNQVIKFASDSETARVGIGETDNILRFGDTSFYESRKYQIEGKYKPSQEIELIMKRAHGSSYKVNYRLQRSATHVEPLASLLVSKTERDSYDPPEWVIWSPRGYYDASSNGDRFIGWHVNRGKNENAKFYKASQFSSELYRPEVIDRIFDAQDTDLAIETFSDEAIELESDFRLSSELEDNAPPTVTIKSPSRDGGTKHNARLMVKVAVQKNSDADITRVEFLVNGLTTPTTGNRPRARGSSRYSEYVELSPGENTISVIAHTRDTKSLPATCTVHFDPKNKPSSSSKGNLYVMAVGISDYESDDIPDLGYAHKDAEDFVKICQAQEGKLYGKVSVSLLTNEEATQKNILKALSKLTKQKPGRKDCAMIMYSGHGFFDEEGEYFFSAHDSDREELLSSAISQETIEKRVSRSLSGCRRLMFIDACHSGASMSSGIQSGNPWHDSGSVVFASSNWNEISFEVKDSKNGALVQALLEATIRPQDADDPALNIIEDEFVSVSELHAYFHKRIPKLTNDRQRGSTAWTQSMVDFPAFLRIDGTEE